MESNHSQMFKRMLIVCLLIFTPMRVWSYSGGTGKLNNPYQIATAEDLIALGNDPNNYDKHFVLTANLDLFGNAFDRALIAADTDEVSSGFQGMVFNGEFDGQGYQIAGLVVDTNNEYAGLFGLIGESGRVLHVNLMEGYVRGAVTYGRRCGTGGIAGENRGLIQNCSCTVEVVGVGNVGGLVGENRGVIITSHSDSTVKGYRSVGGLVGYNNNGMIKLSVSSSIVSATALVGGLVGNNQDGFVALSYSTGMVSGKTDVGGLIGRNDGRIAASYSSSPVEGQDYVGGLVGWNNSSVTSTYSSGDVYGEEQVGGLVGKNISDGDITSSYSKCLVSGSLEVGGLMGYNSGVVSSSFWDTETSGLMTSDGGTGMTTAQMQEPSIYLDAGWDLINERADGTLNLWKVDSNSYPSLPLCSDAAAPLEPVGSGSEEDPYLVMDVNDLGVVWYRPHAHYRLACDIDLSGITWGTAVIPFFDGIWDGDGHVIRNLHIQGGSYLGLFGRLGTDANVSRLGLEAVDIHGTGGYIGSLAGTNDGIVFSNNCDGFVSGRGTVGGLIGCNNEGVITSGRCSSIVSGTIYVGSMAGANWGVIISSYSRGVVNSNSYVGGLVGANGGSIISSYDASEVNGRWGTGGLVGFNFYGDITSCYSIGWVYGTKHVGGLVGDNNHGNITSSYSTSFVSGDQYVGGLVGVNSGVVSSSFWDTETSGLMTSDGGTGMTTAQMQEPSIYLDAGWDLINERADGALNLWKVDSNSYPSLPLCSDAAAPLEPVGSGSKEDPYLLMDVNDLGVVWYRPHAHYRLACDIDLSGITWGTAVIPFFDGIWDGDGHVIRNLHIQGGSYLGLFGSLQPNSIVSHLGLEDVDIDGIGDYVGGLVGENFGEVTTSYSRGSVSGMNKIGGLVGDNDGAISSSYSNSSVIGYSNVGGLVGYGGRSTIYCYSTGLVSGEENVGGLVGNTFSGAISSCFWDTETSGFTYSAGGTGITTSEMQDINTFLNAGWDFVDESVNGTDDIWWMPVSDTPRLWWEAAE